GHEAGALERRGRGTAARAPARRRGERGPVSPFWIVAAALTIAVIGVLAVPLMRRTQRSAADEQDRSNVALYQDQLAELERDRNQGVLSPAQFEQARAELGQRLLAEVDSGQAVARSGGAGAGAWRYAALACVPVVAVAAYLALGAPQALDPAALSGGARADQGAQLALLVEELSARVEGEPTDAQSA